MAKRTLRRGTNPDAALQVGIDLLGAELSTIEDRWELEGGLEDRDRQFLLAATREVRDTAFEARRIVTERMLRHLSAAQVATARELVKAEDEEWLPK